MAGSVLKGEGFAVSFSNREVTAWGGLALFRQMLDSMAFREAAAGWGLGSMPFRVELDNINDTGVSNHQPAVSPVAAG